MTDLFTPAVANAPLATPAPTGSEVDDSIETVKAKFSKNGAIDVDALLKAKAESDKHIKLIEQEQHGLRQELNTRLSYEQFLDEIKASKSASTPVANPPLPNEANEQVVSKDEIARLVKETITAERTQSQKDRNRTQVANDLRKVWGESFPNKLAQKATELNLSKEFLTSVAETNPQAFLKLVDATSTTPVQTPTQAPPSNQVRSGTTPSGAGVRNQAFYADLRKKDTGRYWSVATQAQMHRDAKALGDDFYQ